MWYLKCRALTLKNYVDDVELEEEVGCLEIVSTVSVSVSVPHERHMHTINCTDGRQVPATQEAGWAQSVFPALSRQRRTALATRKDDAGNSVFLRMPDFQHALWHRWVATAFYSFV